MKLTPAASMRIRASPAFGSGSGTSSKWSASGPPAAWTRIAFMPSIRERRVGERVDLLLHGLDGLQVVVDPAEVLARHARVRRPSHDGVATLRRDGRVLALVRLEGLEAPDELVLARRSHVVVGIRREVRADDAAPRPDQLPPSRELLIQLRLALRVVGRVADAAARD